MQNLQMTRAIRLSNAIQDGMTNSGVIAALSESGLNASFGELLRRRGYGPALAQNTSLISAMFNDPSAKSVVTSSPYALAAMLADPALRTALFADPVAMTTIATSRALMTLIAGMSGSVISEVISSATAYNAIAAAPSARATLLASPVLTKVSVPKMTSNTAPSGVVSASSFYDVSLAPWMVFDLDDASYWNSSLTPYGGGGAWLRYSFPSDVHITTLTITPYGAGYSPKDCIIEFSANGSAFSAARAVTIGDGGAQVIDISQYGFYRHWRLRITNDHGAGYVAINSLNFTGFAKPT